MDYIDQEQGQGINSKSMSSKWVHVHLVWNVHHS
jgi:hypothetical protein